MATFIKKIEVFISPNIKSYSNLFSGVLDVSDKTFTSFDTELTLVKYKLPGNGQWATGYVKSEDLED